MLHLGSKTLRHVTENPLKAEFLEVYAALVTLCFNVKLYTVTQYKHVHYTKPMRDSLL